ncbi:hypothetical protein KAT92_03345 [Candidatus Babeliales bacterium]|nr:hypothetical protein [Candidatus Babeliales bacterium]
MVVNGKVWKKNTKKSGGVVAGRRTEATKPTQVRFGSQKIACVLLTENKGLRANQYAGVIENDKERTYVVSDFSSDCQPDKDGWYLCLTPERKQRPLFISGGKPVFTVKIVSAAITAWKSSINSRTTAGYFSPSPNDLFEKEDAVLFFEENGDYFIWIKDPKERTNVLQELNRKEKETMYHKNPWTEKYKLIFSPMTVLSSCLDKREIIKIVFG